MGMLNSKEIFKTVRNAYASMNSGELNRKEEIFNTAVKNKLDIVLNNESLSSDFDNYQNGNMDNKKIAGAYENNVNNLAASINTSIMSNDKTLTSYQQRVMSNAIDFVNDQANYVNYGKANSVRDFKAGNIEVLNNESLTHGYDISDILNAGASIPTKFDWDNSQSTRSVKINNESFDGKDGNALRAVTVTLATAIADQDPVIRTFFKPISMDPKDTAVITSMMVKYVDSRDKTHTNAVKNSAFVGPNDGNTIYKNLNSDIWLSNGLKAVPSLENDKTSMSANSHDARLVHDAQYTFSDNSGSFVTAPYSTDVKQFNMIHLCGRPNIIAKGAMDHTDQLDSYMALSNIYLGFTGKAPGNKKLFHRVDVSGMNGITFLARPQSNNKEIDLKFVSEIAVPTTGLEFKGVETDTLFGDAGKDAYTAVFKVKLMMTVNFDSGSAEIDSKEFELIKIFNNNTNTDIIATPSDSTNADRDAIIEAAKKITFAGFDINAAFTNTNFRHKGMKLAYQINRYAYGCLYTDGVTLENPINGTNVGTDMNQTNISLDDVALVLKLKVKVTGMKTIADWDRKLKEWQETGYKGAPRTTTPALHYLNPYRKEVTYDFTKMVGSLTSEDKVQNIRASVLNNLRLLVNQAANESNYGSIMETVFNNKEKGIIIACDPIVASFLKASDDIESLCAGFKIKIETNRHEVLKDTAYISFGVFSDENDNNIDHMHYGALIEKTPIIAEFSMNRNDATFKEYHVLPAFSYIVNLPISMKINFKGLDDLLSTGAITMKSII